MKICILAVGRQHEQHTKSAIELYEGRLRRYVRLSWEYLPHAGFDDIQRVKTAESDALMAKLKADDTVVLLDERGEQWNSPQFAGFIQNHQTHSRGRLVFIIGGAYGVSGTVFERADTVWSLSKLVFPHQLVRVLLAEQLYRAYAINHSLPYHHG